MKKPEAFELASYLDKSVPNHSVFGKADLARVKRLYKKKLTQIIERSTGQQVQPLPSAFEGKHNLLSQRLTMSERLSQKMVGRNCTKSAASDTDKPRTAVDCEIQKYDAIAADCENPVAALDGQKGLDAHVALACSVFTAINTECPSERVFSHAGQLLGTLCESMSAKSASLFMFLHENIQFWPSDRAIMKAYWAKYYPGVTAPYGSLKS